jgi:hypothetical protein
MTIYTGKDAANRTVLGLKEGVGGVNRDIKEIWTGKDAVNRKVFQSEISFADDCNAISGWSSYLYPTTTLDGSISSDGSAFYAAYGSSSGWHGPGIAKMLPRAITDFDFTFTFSLSLQNANRMNQLVMGLADASNNSVGHVILVDDMVGSYSLKRYFAMQGTGIYGGEVATGSITWTNFNVRMVKIGNNLKCYDGTTLMYDVTVTDGIAADKVFITFNKFNTYNTPDVSTVGNISLTGK